MPADIELGVTFDTDQAVEDLESDLDDVKVGTTAGERQGAAGGAGSELAAGLGVEAGSDIASGGGKGGILGSIAGGIGKIAGLLIGIVAFLALLEPIQKAVSFLVRQFELLVVPVLVALRPFLAALQKAAVSILQLFRNPDEFLKGIKNALAPFVNAVIGGLNNIPGVDIQRINTDGQNRVGFRSTGASTQSRETAETLAESQTRTPGGGLAGIASLGFSTGFSLISDDAAVEKVKQQLANDLGGNLLE